jgi:hypothetical protein
MPGKNLLIAKAYDRRSIQRDQRNVAERLKDGDGPIIRDSSFGSQGPPAKGKNADTRRRRGWNWTRNRPSGGHYCVRICMDQADALHRRIAAAVFQPNAAGVEIRDHQNPADEDHDRQFDERKA